MIQSGANGNRRDPGAIALGLLPYGILLIGAYLTFGHSVDDAYITYRYASNLVAGHGPVFNIGERVEGFSSPLHMILSALLLIIAPGVDIFFKGKLLSLFFGMATVAMLRRAAQRCGLSEGGAVAAQCLLAFNVNFAFASVNGLETTLYAFLVVTAATQFLAEYAPGGASWNGFLSGFLLFLAMLARPDALLLFVALFLVRAFWSRRDKTGLLRTAQWAAAFVVPAALLILARLAYFGSPLPNTYYAKSVSLGYGITQGFPYLWHGLMPSSRLTDDWRTVKTVLTGHGDLAQIALLVSAPLFWGLALIGLSRIRRSIGGAVCAAIIGGLSLFVLLSGGDWMNGWRFMVAALPFFAITQIYGLSYVTEIAAGWSGKPQTAPATAPASSFDRIQTLVYAIAAGFYLFCFVCAPRVSWAKSGFSTQGEALMASDVAQNGPFEVAVGNYIRDRLPMCKHIAYSEMGYATFVNRDKAFLDTGGLTNKTLAHAPRKYKIRGGFHDSHWRNPGSPLYQVLQQTRPDAIMAVAILSPDQTNDPVLGVYRPIPPVGVTPNVKFGDRVARIYLSPAAYAAYTGKQAGSPAPESRPVAELGRIATP